MAGVIEVELGNRKPAIAHQGVGVDVAAAEPTKRFVGGD